MMPSLRSLLKLKRRNKRIVTVCYDIIAIIGSLYLATAMRLATWHIPVNHSTIFAVITTVIMTLVIFTKLGMYRAVLRYLMIPALGYIIIAVVLSALTLVLTGFLLQTFIPRSVPFIYTAFAIVTLGGPRILIRTFYYHYYKRRKPNVFIYGAGSTGRELAYALIQGDEYHPVIVIDDDRAKVGQIMFGLRVHHSSEFNNLKTLYDPVKLLLAVNNISKGDRLRLVEKTSNWPIVVQSVPSVEDIAAGKAHSTEIIDLDVADLLGRIPVEPDKALLAQNIAGKNILISGAGGSIGSELCRQILQQKPAKIVLFELNEYNLYAIDKELKAVIAHTKSKTQVVALLGSVQHLNRLKRVMIKNNIETVFHAAAYKHVPIVEDNIIEGIRNNVFGTLFIAEAAIAANVKNFTLISTDKAVRPTNIMGATKRLAELVLQALADRQDQTCFTMVRFGNVLDSSGSVVPLFREQIKKGGPVTVTHPDINRFFMLIPEAAQLVIQASAFGKNGQVFVLDMGEPVKILDLARRMILLMGMTEKNPVDDNASQSNHDLRDGDIEIKFTGLRPGEKLYEELLIGDNVTGTSHPKIMTANEQKLTWDEMEVFIKRLEVCSKEFDVEGIRRVLLEAPAGYVPKGSNKRIVQ